MDCVDHGEGISYVESLPTELLAAIFKAGSLIPPTRYEHPFPLLVSSVSRHWREVAIHSPDIWATIYITRGRRSKTVSLFLERSKSALLDITLDHYGYIDPTILTDISDLINSCISRWRRFRASADNLLWIHEFLKPSRNVPAPQLEHIQLCVRDDHGRLEPPDHQPLLAGGPALRSLKLQGISSLYSPPLIGLTTLDIASFRPSYRELRDLFSDSPALSTLVLRKYGVSPFVTFPSDNNHVAIEARSLRSLAITFDHDHLTFHCPCAISFLSMPNLEYLEIVNSLIVPDLVEHFTSQQKQYRQLHTLRLDRLEPSTIDRAFFYAFPMLMDLEVDTVQAFSDLVHLKDGANHELNHQTPLWEQLRSVTFESLIDDLTCFYEAIRARSAAGYPISTVYLPPISWSDDSFLEITLKLEGCLEVKLSDSLDGGFITFEPFLNDDEDDDDWSSSGSPYDYSFDSGSDEDYEIDYEDEYEDDGLEGVESYH